MGKQSLAVITRIVGIAFLCSAFLVQGNSAHAAGPGGVFVTGHDPDFHAIQGGNTPGAQHVIQKAVGFVTYGKANPKILLVTDLNNPGAGYSDPRPGLTAAGFTFDVAVAKDGSPANSDPSALDLSAVPFGNYDAIVVASDFGGWLRQTELNILIARKVDLFTFINTGGGLVAFAESGPPYGLTTGAQYGYLPFLVSQQAKNQSEVGFTVTSFGMGLGLADSDVNGNASHNIFTATGGLNVVDHDADQAIVSLAERGQLIGDTGCPTCGGTDTPEAPSSVLFGGGVALALLGLGIRGRRRSQKSAA